MATMQQAGTETREFAQELEMCARDLGMAKEDVKAHLVSALNQATLSYVQAYVTMCGSDEMAHLETIQDRLHCIPYILMLAFLK